MLKLFLDDLKREAIKENLFQDDYKVTYDDWECSIFDEKRKYNITNGVHQLIVGFHRIFEASEDFKPGHKFNLDYFINSVMNRNDVFTHELIERFYYIYYVDFLKILLESFRIAVTECLFENFLHDFIDESSNENLWDPNVLVDIGLWRYYIEHEYIHGEEAKVAREMTEFMKEIRTKLPHKMISITTFYYAYLNFSFGRSFSPLTHCLKDFLIRLLIRTFKEAESDADWSDIMTERIFSDELRGLDLKTWATAHCKINYQEFDETKLQDYITATEEFYDKRVVALIDGFPVIQLK